MVFILVKTKSCAKNIITSLAFFLIPLIEKLRLLSLEHLFSEVAVAELAGAVLVNDGQDTYLQRRAEVTFTTRAISGPLRLRLRLTNTRDHTGIVTGSHHARLVHGTESFWFFLRCEREVRVRL